MIGRDGVSKPQERVLFLFNDILAYATQPGFGRSFFDSEVGPFEEFYHETDICIYACMMHVSTVKVLSLNGKLDINHNFFVRTLPANDGFHRFLVCNYFFIFFFFVVFLE